ncbi:hypothetical protein TNCV_4567891 [Trichonephila clavipes]|nr:hypothetical protein TNCV_4567891 [Trichonephila clavipes]
MIAQRYVNDILQPDVLPHMQRQSGAIFQQDSECTASHGKGVTRLYPHCYYPSMACPTPNLSPMEHI